MNNSIYKKIILLFSIIIMQNISADQSMEISLDNSKSNLKINTSRSLNYGIMSKTNYENSTISDLLLKPVMIKRQEKFFDAKNAMKKWDMKKGQFTSSTINLNELSYNSTNKEYILFTEFDRFSKPALMNYVTMLSIVASTVLDSSEKGKLIYNSSLDGINDINKKVSKIIGTTSDIIVPIDTIVTVIETFVNINKDDPTNKILIDKLAQVKSILNTTDTALKNIKKVFPTKIPPNKYDKKPIEATLARLLQFRNFKDISSAFNKEDKFVGTTRIKSIAFSIVLNKLLKKVVDDKKIYFPKDLSSPLSFNTMLNIIYGTAKLDKNKFDSISLYDVAKSFSLMSESKLGKTTPYEHFLPKKSKKEAKKIMSFIKYIIVANSTATFTKWLNKSTNQLVLSQGLLNGLKNIKDSITKVNGKVIYKFAESQVLKSMEDLRLSVYEFGEKMALYAVPGGGWAKMIIDLSKLANTGGKYAYDFATAPREIPFKIQENGEVIKPFALNALKYSFLYYPNGKNTLDRYSDGDYTYESYFLYANSPKEYDSQNNISKDFFLPYNINNRDASLVVSGVTYSYEMLVGNYDDDGENFIKKIRSANYYKNQAMHFSFNIFKNNEDEPFISSITGVSNSHDSYLSNSDIQYRYSVKQLSNPGSQVSGQNIYIPDTTPNYNKIAKSYAKVYEYDKYGINDHIRNIEDPFEYLDYPDSKEFWYISYKDNISEIFKKDYADGGSKKTYWDNYKKNKGITHLTPGIFTIYAQMSVNNAIGYLQRATVFKDRHKLFVMAPVSQGYKTNVYNAKDIMIPFIGSSSNNGIDNKWFEFDKKTGKYLFCFTIDEENTISNFKRQRDIRIALYHRNTITNKNENVSFYTLPKSLDKQNIYKIPIDNKGYIINGKIDTSKHLVIAWYDDMIQKFEDYTGIQEKEVIEALHTKLKKTNRLNDAAYKAFSYREITSIPVKNYKKEVSLPLDITFPDIDDNYWAKKYIDRLANLGIINGYKDDNGKFKPKNNVSIGEFLGMSTRALFNKNFRTTLDNIRDINNITFSKYVEFLHRLNIDIDYNTVSKYSSKILEKPATRKYIAKVLTNMLTYKKENIRYKKLDGDWDSYSDYLNSHCISQGKKDTLHLGFMKFAPNDYITRDEVSVMIVKSIDANNKTIQKCKKRKKYPFQFDGISENIVTLPNTYEILTPKWKQKTGLGNIFSTYLTINAYEGTNDMKGEYQCTDLVKRFYKGIFNMPITSNGSGQYVAQNIVNNSKSYKLLYNNKEIILSYYKNNEAMQHPVNGSVISFDQNNNSIGHVAIAKYTSCNNDETLCEVYLFEQNYVYNNSMAYGRKAIFHKDKNNKWYGEVDGHKAIGWTLATYKGDK